VGTRWINQQPGGHCRQETINEQGIGICLVGDFSKARPTEKQLETLARLVYDLQQQFGIAPENILGHGQVLGEFSECPGDHFPWEKFRASLRQVADADRIESLRAAAAAFSSSLRVPPLNP
jgi:N-acetyl-anhydromuramyl-L-alanine amidase AmpD